MLSRTKHAGQCIYCAFRIRRLELESLRLGRHHGYHTSSSKHKERGPNVIRFTGTRGSTRGNSPHYIGKAEKDGPVRKFFQKIDREAVHSPKKDFTQHLQERLDYVKSDLKNAPLLEQLRKEKASTGQKSESFEKIWRTFTSQLLPQINDRLPFFAPTTAGKQRENTLKDLHDAFRNRGINGLDDRIKYAFYGHLTGSRFTTSDIKNQQALADLRYPSEWFPATREIHRTIHLHVGPTNSGKTYHALQRLEQAESGVYAGPLRLLAHEVYTRMNAKGKTCSLITGEERRMADKESGDVGSMAACTVEMMPLNKSLDVAVIDEIQMIGNAERGWAWTQALLGVKAKEVHLCGEERTVPLLRELCASLGEKLEIHRYERLSPLKVAEQSLDGKLKDLRKGDCIVSFSVMGIHALRRQIERATGKKVATVYGSLPPETRAQQARLFNDPENEYDYLVASDAVGMGLNLAIKRIIFESSSKFDGNQRRTLGVADIKQIAGRAGRYRIASMQSTRTQAEADLATQDLAAAKGDSPSPPPTTEEETTGLVTTLEKFDFPIVSSAMTSNPEPITTAGLFPPAPVLERFASYFPPSTPFSYILTRLHELSQMHTRFHLCGLKDQVWIADLIEPVQGLTIGDRNVICSSPASKSDGELWQRLMPAYARCIGEQTGGAIYGIEELPLEVLEAEVSASREYLRELERLHKGIVTYLWLSYRFAGIFGTRSLAFHVKGLVEEKIEEVLGKFSFSEAGRRRVAARREQQVLEDMDVFNVNETEEAGKEEPGVVDSEEYDDVSEREGVRKEVLEEQTTLTSGGDHFSGEEVDLGVREPEDDAQDVPISKAMAEGKEAALESSRLNELEALSEERPSIEDAAPESAAEQSSPASSEALSPEQDPTDLEAQVTPETELSDKPAPIENSRGATRAYGESGAR